MVEAIAQYYHDDPAPLPWLKQAFPADKQKGVRRIVARVIDRIYSNDIDEPM